MSLSRKQNAIYRPLVKAAYLAYLEQGGAIHFDPWYRQELLAAAGIHTTKEIQKPEELDPICIHFATLGNDQEQIDYWSRAPERRALWRLEQTMHKAVVGWEYVRAIAKQMGYKKPLEDLPAELVLKINTALYVHWKRHKGKMDSDF